MSKSPADSLADASTPAPKLPFSSELFRILVCPQSQASLKYVDGKLVSRDAETRRSYRIEGDIPIMLLDESEVLSPEAWQAAMDAVGIVAEDLNT